MQIIYQEIDAELLEKMIAHFSGMEKTIRGHIHFEAGSYSLAALHEDKPAGFISAYTEVLEKPLGDKKDAYIDIIEVDKNYRRQGIARGLVERTEKWARSIGFSQIRAWSSQDKIEAIPMWYALNYCMCPAKIWVEWCEEIVDGYYAAKMLNCPK